MSFWPEIMQGRNNLEDLIVEGDNNKICIK
jgi:hypothetical protein